MSQRSENPNDTKPSRGEDGPKTPTLPHRGEDPGPEGPEGEEVGEEQEEAEPQEEGIGLAPTDRPLTPDANPIDPRVF